MWIGLLDVQGEEISFKGYERVQYDAVNLTHDFPTAEEDWTGIMYGAAFAEKTGGAPVKKDLIVGSKVIKQGFRLCLCTGRYQ